MDGYKVAAKRAQIEMIERKSRFIGDIAPVKDEADALAFIAAIRKAHPDATHVVHAYLVHSPFTVRFCDDGEPKGTAGRPALEVLQREDVWDVCLTVTRYFGGILLGAGGLVRAYAKAAKLALCAAGTATLREKYVMRAVLPYGAYPKMEDYLRHAPIDVLDSRFTDEVTLALLLEPAYLPDLQSFLQQLTGGQVQAQYVETRLVAAVPNGNV